MSEHQMSDQKKRDRADYDRSVGIRIGLEMLNQMDIIMGPVAVHHLNAFSSFEFSDDEDERYEQMASRMLEMLNDCQKESKAIQEVIGVLKGSKEEIENDDELPDSIKSAIIEILGKY
jgi:hypothetical protein